jgi:hypothetical protein
MDVIFAIQYHWHCCLVQTTRVNLSKNGFIFHFFRGWQMRKLGLVMGMGMGGNRLGKGGNGIGKDPILYKVNLE